MARKFSDAVSIVRKSPEMVSSVCLMADARVMTGVVRSFDFCCERMSDLDEATAEEMALSMRDS